MRPALEGEVALGEPTHPPSEEGFQMSPNPPPSQGEGETSRKPNTSLSSLVILVRSREQLSNSGEYLLGIRPADHEVHHFEELAVRRLEALLDVCLPTPDLSFDYVTQAEFSRHRLRRIFILENLSRQILGAENLKQRQRDR